MPQTLPLSVNAPAIQWYPGHIAKAEKALSANLAKVDLVIEVRDARIPMATSHPRLQRWIGNKQHLLVLNRVDMIPPPVRQAWTAWFRAQEQTCWWCDAKAGTGVKQLQQAAIRAGIALINRLVRQKVVDSARRAGVTRSLRWVRLGQDLDLLDAPGVLPPRLDDQQAALRLALCDDIGQAAYDNEAAARAFLQLLTLLEAEPAAGVPAGLVGKRYGIPLGVLPGGGPDVEGWLVTAAERHTSGDSLRMATKLLDDFRCARLGAIALELPVLKPL